jgi:hypothetical protein
MRFKPDIVTVGEIWSAHGDGNLESGCHLQDSFQATFMSGTSMATPITAGVVALLRQYIMEGKVFKGLTESADPNPQAFLPSAALLKAILLHSGREVAYNTILGKYSKDLHLPNYAQGFGSIHLESVLGLGKSMLSTAAACTGPSSVAYDRYECGAVGCCAWDEAAGQCVSATVDVSYLCEDYRKTYVQDLRSQYDKDPDVLVQMRVEHEDAVGSGETIKYCVQLSGDETAVRTGANSATSALKLTI